MSEVTFPGSPEGRYDYDLAEHYTGVAWIDNKPIYRRVIEIAGGNGSSSTGAIADLNSVNRATIVRVAFAMRAPLVDDLLFLLEQMTIKHTTGAVELAHTGVDFTGITLHLIVEYTKV